MLDTLAWIRAGVGFEPPAIEGSVEHRIVGIIRGVDWDRAWVVKEPYDVVSRDVGRLLDFSNVPGTIKGVVPNEGFSGQLERKRSGRGRRRR